MGEFLDAALGFPTVLFSFSMVVVLAYWLLALLGALDVGMLDSDAGDGDGLGPSAVLGAVGLGGVPATVSLSLLIALAWFFSLVGNVVIDSLAGSLSTPVIIVLGILALIIAVTIAWGLTSGVVMGLRRFVPGTRDARTSGELVGRTCTVRTLRVDREFGQAEVVSGDGSTLLIQVRTIDDEPLASGDTALIFDHDAKAGFFRVSRFDPALDPGES
ncbi:DUF1449 family protein [Nocardiopsis composta]|uniref:DUF1449 family protein n=1 Tax=Nocardiopsis composta TaxID=157465 RepID=A0A7W8QN06_9ACTN|nr:DUF1449 family protein [Nocardiopsis composta]MBB5433291.1 hypothetical protein [Nocardiopsis composta]